MPVSKGTVAGANAIVKEANIYKMDIMLSNNVAVLNINVFEMENSPGCDLLIGMDIITHGDFAITNAGGKTFASFRMPPADQHINYVEIDQKTQ